jgi:hypothetical protein
VLSNVSVTVSPSPTATTTTTTKKKVTKLLIFLKVVPEYPGMLPLQVAVVVTQHDHR